MPAFTWGWLAEQIADGIVSGLASKAIASISNDGINIQALIQEFVDQVSAIINTALLEDRISKNVANCQSLQDLIAIYVANPEATLFDQLLVKASDIVNESESIGYVQSAPAVISGNIMLTFLADIYNKNLSAENQKNLYEYSRKLLGMSEDWEFQIDKYNQGRFSAVYKNFLEPFHWAYTLDGNEVVTGISIFLNDGTDGRKTADDVRWANIHSEFNRLWGVFGGPATPSILIWGQMIKRYYVKGD